MSSLIEGFVALVVIFVVFNGYDGAPQPCPQFLPVAVQVDQHTPSSHSYNDYNIQGGLRRQEYKAIQKKPENNLVVSPTGLLLRDEKEATTKKSDEPKLLLISELSTTASAPKSQRPKKRRRTGPKDSKMIILNRNSNWALKTINDKPAEEVLMTDKASAARDLKDSTESALVEVKKLENQ